MNDKIREIQERGWPAEGTELERESSVYPRSPLGEQVEGLPTGRDVEWEPLVDYRRNGVSETTIHGAVAWAVGGEIFHSARWNHDFDWRGKRIGMVTSRLVPFMAII